MTSAVDNLVKLPPLPFSNFNSSNFQASQCKHHVSHMSACYEEIQ